MKKPLFIFALDLMTAKGDKGNFFRTLAETGITGVRIGTQYAWNENVCSPYPQVATWKAGYADAPDMAFYSQGDESQAAWSASWIEGMREIAALCRKYHRAAYICAHDGCSILQSGRPGWAKYLYPFLSSSPDKDYTNPGYDKYPGGFWALREFEGGRQTVQFLHERLIDKILEIFSGVDLWIEFANEDPGIDLPDDYMREYYKWLKTVFDKRGVKSIGSGRQAGIEYLDFYSIHGISRPEDVPDSGYPHEKIMVSTDGGFLGNGRPDAKGRRGPDGGQAAAIAQKALDMDYAIVELMDRGVYRENNDQSNLDDFDPEIFVRAVEVLKH